MKKIVIWGTGEYASYVYKSILTSECDLIGFVDNDAEKQNSLWMNKYRVYSLKTSLDMCPDYYLVSALYSHESIFSQAKELGIENKLIWYWNEELEKYKFIKNDFSLKEKILLNIKIAKLERMVDNAPFEYGKTILKIKSANELLNKIFDEQCSLCRFGDGEFDMILNQERAWFQKCNSEMGKRLRDIINSNNPKVLIAIADNYGNLDKYTEDAADAIRKYMTKEKRELHMEILDKSRYYYDAYVSRPYMIYKDKEANASRIFRLYKKIFRDRDIFIVEGRHTKNGVNNDLLAGARSIKRIICPDANAYDYYDKILKNTLDTAKKSDLILISLGSTATILAYDLAMLGYQAMDLGQLDNEYEWFLMHASEREVIEGKSVSELNWYRIPRKEFRYIEYDRQIIKYI